ncbi:hypothetical protein D5086_032862 [Populus alba]|uniref:Uncharacterized protein n=1 Tax=Populus alba TaxID=43335 RepID=A0ACC4AF79_POPAL
MDLEATKNLSESHTIGNYILKSKLGESSFSTVWKAENKTTGGEVAVKQVYLSNLNKNLRNCLDCELNFLSFFNHPNIIRLLDVFESHHIIHRDLKPENILLSGKESDVVLKIADFGLSRRVLPDNYVETVCGSPFYMAPEVLQFQRYDCKVDMWSVGVILFELLNGYPPFRARTNFQVVSFLSTSVL